MREKAKQLARSLLSSYGYSPSLHSEVANLILNMAAELERVKRERDAAVYDLRNFSLNVCMTCKRSTGLNECEVFGKRELPEGEFVGLCGQYEWRGPCKENGGMNDGGD